MSTTKKVLIIIATIILLAAFICAVVWGVINWTKVQELMKGTGIYTQEDIQKSYEDGFNKALSDKNEYEKLINSYKDTITTQNDLIARHSSEVATLNNTIKEFEEQLQAMTEQRDNLQTQITTLTAIKETNEATIAELNIQIDTLSKKVVELQGNVAENATQIENLNNQITNLQSLNSQLQSTNELNTQTINNLTAQNTALNNRITEITYQLENHASIVASLNTKIAELQKSVQYYEQYLSTLEQGEQVIATFEFNGSVYNIQVVNKNSTLSVTTPQSTEYVIFNYWTVDGERIDLETFKILQNTRIIANITLKFDIKFIVESETIQSSVMLKDSKITPPTAPVKSGYIFEGWTTDGTNLVDFDTYKVFQNTTFTPKYVKQYSVKFMYEDTVISNQTIKSGEYATLPDTTSTTYKVFNGWKLNNVIIDIENFKINEDATFIADITYKYDVKFMVDNEIVNSQIVIKNNIANSIESPIKDGFVFDCWTINGTDSVNISSYKITTNTTFVAKFKQIFIIEFVVNDQVYNTQSVVEGRYIEIVNNPSIDGCTFLGWTTNGVDVIPNINNIPVTANVRYIAKIELLPAKMISGKSLTPFVKDTATSIIFDKYTGKNEYLVGGTNVISGISPTNITANDNKYGSVELYMVGASAYVLSDRPIALNEDSSEMFYRCYDLASITFKNVNTSNVKNMRIMFGNCWKLTSIDLSMFDTSSVTNMSQLFWDCSKLESINISNFNTSKVTTMFEMFRGNKVLKSIDVSSFDTRNVTDMSSMFTGCLILTNLNVSNFNTSNVTTMQEMFCDCRALTSLDISNFKTGKVTNTRQMFRECRNLTKIYVSSSWNMSKVSDSYNMFYDSTKLPNFSASQVDKSKAHTGSGGYLTLKG